MSCTEIRPYLQAYVDDELSAEKTIGMELHLAECCECNAEAELTRSLVRATRTSVTEVTMCPQFQSRLRQALAEECERQEHDEHSLLSWRVIAPLAAAAAVALFFALGMNAQSVERGRSLQVGRNDIVDFMVHNHTTVQEPSTRERAAVAKFEQRLGFPVRAPDLARFGAEFEGASVVSLDRTRVAIMRYSIGGRRISLYMYDPDQLPLRAEQALKPRVVGNRAVFVGNRQGYSIATSERRGVGYAIAGELSREESAELVVAAYR